MAVLSPSFIKSDRAKIINTLTIVKELANKNGDEHPFEMLRKAREIGDHIADQAEIVYHHPEEDESAYKIKSSREISDKIYAARSQVNYIATDFRDAKIEVDADRATVRLKGRADFRFPDEEQLYREEMQLILSLRKEDGTWLLVRAENVK
jgi:hypothetical protein